jgi:hypothetical protein
MVASNPTVYDCAEGSGRFLKAGLYTIGPSQNIIVRAIFNVFVHGV